MFESSFGNGFYQGEALGIEKGVEATTKTVQP